MNVVDICAKCKHLATRHFFTYDEEHDLRFVCEVADCDCLVDLVALRKMAASTDEWKRYVASWDPA